MSFNYTSLKKNGYTLSVSLLALLTFLILFVFRAVDDNRLTSWQWTFADADIIRIFFILICGIVAAYILSRFSFPERIPAVFLFFISFLTGMLFWKEPELIVDTSRYFTQAKHLGIYGIKYFIAEWGRSINAWTDLPLVPFLYGLIFKFFGESRICIQIFTTSLFSMTVVVTYLIGKTLWNKDVGFSAGLLLLGIPYLLPQVPLMLTDVPTMFFLTFSIFTFIKAIERGRIWIVVSSFAIFLAFFSKYSTWLMLSVLVVIFVIYTIKRDTLNSYSSQSLNSELPGLAPRSGAGPTPNYFYRGILTLLIPAFLIGIVILLKFDVFSTQIKLLLNYQMSGLRRWGESFISTFFYQIHPFITIVAVYSVYIAFKKRDLKYAVISYLTILVVLFQIKRIRYIMIMFPMFTLMASCGLQEIKNKELKRFIVYCIIISSLVIAVFVHLPFLEKTGSVNLMNAGRFLNSIKEPNIEVLAIPSKDDIVNPAVSVPILNLFTRKDICYHYDASLSPSFEMIRESPLRFTWEYKNPDYYDTHKCSKGDTAIVVISNMKGELLPGHIEQKIKGYKESKVFKTSTEVFSYMPIVRIYQFKDKNG